MSMGCTLANVRGAVRDRSASSLTPFYSVMGGPPTGADSPIATSTRHPLTGRPLPMMISSTMATCSRLAGSYCGVVTHLRDRSWEQRWTRGWPLLPTLAPAAAKQLPHCRHQPSAITVIHLSLCSSSPRLTRKS